MFRLSFACIISILMMFGYGICSGKSIEQKKVVETYDYEGKFKWSKKGEKEYQIKGIFTKNEKGNYDAKFLFDWGTTAHIYTGIVKGDIEKGPISGQIYNDNKKREFAFKCDFKDGKFTGTHQEIRRKKRKETGVIYFSKIK
jgi:hypothetical protein